MPESFYRRRKELELDNAHSKICSVVALILPLFPAERRRCRTSREPKDAGCTYIWSTGSFVQSSPNLITRAEWEPFRYFSNNSAMDSSHAVAQHSKSRMLLQQQISVRTCGPCRRPSCSQPLSLVPTHVGENCCEIESTFRRNKAIFLTLQLNLILDSSSHHLHTRSLELVHYLHAWILHETGNHLEWGTRFARAWKKREVCLACATLCLWGKYLLWWEHTSFLNHSRERIPERKYRASPVCHKPCLQLINHLLYF